MLTEEPQNQNYTPPNYVSFNQIPPPLPPHSVRRSLVIEPNAPHWNWLSAVGILFLSILAIFIFPNIAFVVYAVANQIPPAEWSKLIEDPNAIVAALASTFPAHIFTLLAAWLLVTRIGKQSFWQTLGWRWNGFNFIYCFLITVGLYAVALGVAQFFPEQENSLTKMLESSRAAALVTAALATLTAPLVEEVVYRGVLYPAFRKSFGAGASVALVTLTFALIHVPQYWPSYGTIIAITMLSLTLTLVRAFTKNLLPCVVIHTIFNGITSILLIAQPYIEKSHAPDADPTAILRFW